MIVVMKFIFEDIEFSKGINNFKFKKFKPPGGRARRTGIINNFLPFTRPLLDLTPKNCGLYKNEDLIIAIIAI